MIFRLGPIVIRIGGGDHDGPSPEAYRALIAAAAAKARARLDARRNG